MNKLLSIIIPQYKETFDDMKVLFDMLDKQEGVDFNEFEVAIVNDCGVPLNEKDFKNFKNLNKCSKFLSTDANGGPGKARQYGINNTTGDYIMFIDADDCIGSISSVQRILHFIKSKRPDGIRGKFFNEEANELFNDITWLHGKVYSRSVLARYDIKFPDLRLDEDVYFNMVFYNLPIEVLDIDDILVIWRNNKRSLTRRVHDDQYYINYYKCGIVARKMGVKKLSTILRPEDLLDCMIQNICWCYFDSQIGNRIHWYRQPEVKCELCDIFNEWANPHDYEGRFRYIYNDVRMERFKPLMILEHQTFDEFYTDMGAE